MHTWVSFYIPELHSLYVWLYYYSISTGTFSGAVLEEIKGHPNAEFKSGKLEINLRYLGYFEKCQSDESELKWPPDSHLTQ